MKIKYQHQTTQAYWAGAMTAKLHNIYYTRSDKPSVIRCMRDFPYLRVVYGRYYSLLKGNKFGNPFVIKYEEFDKIELPQTLRGNVTDFMLGYADFVKKKRI